MVLQRLYGHSESDEAIQALHADILQTVAVETRLGTGTWKDILKSDSMQSRRRLFLAMGIQMMQQLGGNTAVLYYANTLFENSVGFSAHDAGLMSGYLSTWFFASSFVPLVLIDRIGRRPLVSKASIYIKRFSRLITFTVPVNDSFNGYMYGCVVSNDLPSSV
jgi:hypothetical protein